MTRPAAARSGAATLPTTFATPDGAVAAARTTSGNTRTVPTQRVRSRRAQPAAVPLGSIATAPPRTAPGTSACAECASTALTYLQMTLTDGSPVVFVSCHECEHTGWFAVDGIGTTLSLDAVLDSATKVH